MLFGTPPPILGPEGIVTFRDKQIHSAEIRRDLFGLIPAHTKLSDAYISFCGCIFFFLNGIFQKRKPREFAFDINL